MRFLILQLVQMATKKITLPNKKVLTVTPKPVTPRKTGKKAYV